jgi:phage antirepressor YoqD-like protein
MSDKPLGRGLGELFPELVAQQEAPAHRQKNRGLTMDSRDIAELCEKQHGHVCRDIITMLEGLGLDQSRFGAVYKAGNGEDRRCFKLPYRETMILVSGYRVELRAKVVDRWMELERQAAAEAFNIPKDYASALRLAADQAEQIEAQRSRLAVVEPLAQVAEQIANSGNLRTVTDFGKIIGIGPRKIFDELEKKQIIFRSHGRWQPFVYFVNHGYFVMRESAYTDSDGQQHTAPQMYLTGKGEVWLTNKLQGGWKVV